MADNELTVKPELTDGERFVQKVVSEFETTFGEVTITNYQKRLIQNYFITIDGILKKMEQKRDKEPKSKFYEPLAAIWKNVNMPELYRLSKHVSKLGLDSLQDNNLSFIILKDKALNLYTVGFWKGYIGKELIATKYAIDMPIITCELIYSNDTFTVYKRDKDTPVETYALQRGNVFDEERKVVGGFYYYDYENKAKNKVFTMTLKDILKRKPKKASADFWGGEKDVWEDGKKTGKKEQVEGWFEEMCEKTIKNKAYGSITLDPQKIDDTYQFLKQQESDFVDTEAEEEIEQNANKEVIEISSSVITLIDLPSENKEPF